MAKHLSSIVPLIPCVVRASNTAADPVILDITSDSRQVTSGSLFIAVRGAQADGSAYIHMAIERGACVIVSESPPPERIPDALAWIQVESSRQAVSAIASTWYSVQPEYVVAVTGTDGKTSTADFFRQICMLAGKKAASIGTLGVLGSTKTYSALNTTPDPILLHRTLEELALEGITHVAIEASSHGLDQHRLHGVRVCAAAFTTFTRDHLDYHHTMEDYLHAKLKLFTEVLSDDGVAVINADIDRFEAIAEACNKASRGIQTYGLKGEHYHIHDVLPDADGLHVHLSIRGKEYRYTMPMYGAFQAYNFVAALVMAQACGIECDPVLARVGELKGVPGRLEYVAAHPVHHAPIFIDYAHTPSALENILKTVRPHISNNLVTVFGCGGDRDKGKRPQMGLAAVTYADRVVVTDDNPRSENPDVIREEVLAPLSDDQRARVKNIGDRKEAIAFAIAALQKGDGLVIAGKGHERTQIIGSNTIAFDDAEVAREIVRTIRG